MKRVDVISVGKVRTLFRVPLKTSVTTKRRKRWWYCFRSRDQSRSKEVSPEEEGNKTFILTCFVPHSTHTEYSHGGPDQLSKTKEDGTEQTRVVKRGMYHLPFCRPLLKFALVTTLPFYYGIETTLYWGQGQYLGREPVRDCVSRLLPTEPSTLCAAEQTDVCSPYKLNTQTTSSHCPSQKRDGNLICVFLGD